MSRPLSSTQPLFKSNFMSHFLCHQSSRTCDTSRHISQDQEQRSSIDSGQSAVCSAQYIADRGHCLQSWTRMHGTRYNWLPREPHSSNRCHPPLPWLAPSQCNTKFIHYFDSIECVILGLAFCESFKSAHTFGVFVSLFYFQCHALWSLRFEFDTFAVVNLVSFASNSGNWTNTKNGCDKELESRMRLLTKCRSVWFMQETFRFYYFKLCECATTAGKSSDENVCELLTDCMLS